MWLHLALWKVCTQDLKAFLPSSFPQRFSRRGPVYCPEWTSHGRALTDRGWNLYGDLTHVFCPAEPTKNCPRDQPQDNSALHSSARAAPTDPRQLPSLEGQPLRMGPSAALAPPELGVATRLVHFSFLPLRSPTSCTEGCFPSAGGRPRLGSSPDPPRKSRWHGARISRGKAVTKANHY